MEPRLASGKVSASIVASADVNWVVRALVRRREPLVEFAPVYWRPAPDASARHRAFMEYLLSEGGAKAYRTDHSVLVAVPRGDGWLVDDVYVPGSDWAAGDGGELWNVLDRETHEADVRFVCPTYEKDRAEFARSAGLTIAESWWLMELPSASGGASGIQVQLPGAEAITVAAPPVYDPHGPILFLPVLDDPLTALPAAVESAPHLGCPAIVVNQVAGDDALAEALSESGFRRHCDFYTGTINPI